MTNHPSDSSSTMAEAEVEELGDIIKDLSDGDNDDSHDNKKITKIIVMMMTTRKNKKLS